MNFPPRSRVPAIAAVLAFLLSAPAFAETITVRGISVKGSDGYALSVPSIEATDSSLDEAGTRALFGADYASTFKNLATLNAASLKVPTITMTYEVPAMDGSGKRSAETVIFSDFEMTDVENGVARGGARLGSIEMLSAGVRFVVGEMTASYFDLGAIVDFYGLAGDHAASETMVPVYENFTMASVDVSGPGLNCHVGPATASEFSARPLKYSFADLMAKTEELEAAETGGSQPSAETISWLINFYADFFTAITSTPSTLSGMTCSVEDPVEHRTINVTAGDMTIDGFEPGIYPAIALNDFNVEVPSEGFFKFGNFTWKKIDFNAPIAAIHAAGDAIDFEWFEDNWRKLIPALDGLSFSGVSFDIPDEQSGTGARIAGGVDAFDISLADYVNGIPSTLSASTSGLTFATPEGESGAALRALGIETLNLGADIKLHWDEATKTIAVENVAISGVDMGSLAIHGTIANAGPELFSDDLDVATAASMALTVTSVTIDIENQGIAPLLIASAAADQNVPPDSLYMQLVAMSRALPMGILGANAEALKVGEALGGFFEGAPKLTLTLASVDPRGVGLAEFMAAQQDPEALKGKFTIVAEASGEKVPFVFPELPKRELTPPPPQEFPSPPPTDAQPPAEMVPPVDAPPPADDASPRQQEKQGSKN